MATQPKRRRARFDRLSDAQLHALLTHIRTVLLDRPNMDMDLSVYLLRADEARLVTLYQALPPATREDELARIERALSMPAAACAPRPLSGRAPLAGAFAPDA